MTPIYNSYDDRMRHYPKAAEIFRFYPFGDVMRVFNQMFLDRENEIFTTTYKGHDYTFSKFSEWGWFWERCKNTASLFREEGAIYPQPIISEYPLLQGGEAICAYASKKYPDFHFDRKIYPGRFPPRIEDYGCHDFCPPETDGFMDAYTFFGTLWNYLNFFGGFAFPSPEKPSKITFARETENIFTGTGIYDLDLYNPAWNSFQHSQYDGSNMNQLQLFHTPDNNWRHKYLVVAASSGDNSTLESFNIAEFQYGFNVIHESDWVTGPYETPWFIPRKGTRISLSGITLYIYTRYPDCYDPGTLEPIWFD